MPSPNLAYLKINRLLDLVDNAAGQHMYGFGRAGQGWRRKNAGVLGAVAILTRVCSSSSSA
jgi:hypothetical protein